MLNGWNSTGELDAAVTHLAKVRNVMRYLDDLPATANDDLVLIVDGYDVVMHLPAEIMIQRYFSVIETANKRLDERFGKGYKMTRLGGFTERPRQSILFGPDKVCWPEDERRPACWAVPEDTGMPAGAFGPPDGSIHRHPPRWLNSGTIMGPVGDMRQMFAVTLERIRTTYDPEYYRKESDQMYMSDVWGEQEYYRSVRELKPNASENMEDDPIPPGGPEDKFIPKILPRQKTEYHIAMDYESELFQTRAGNELILEFLPFDGADNSIAVDENRNEAEGFEPYRIYLPSDVVASLKRLFTSISAIHPLPSSKLADLIASLPFGVNIITRHIYALYHCTGEKGYLDSLWPTLWFYPYTKPLLTVAIQSMMERKPISENLIDGRKWTAATTFPSLKAGEIADVTHAGAWADLSDGWVGWDELCQPHEQEIFQNDQSER